MGFFNLGGRHSDQGGMVRNEGWGERQFKKVIQWYNKDKDNRVKIWQKKRFPTPRRWPKSRRS